MSRIDLSIVPDEQRDTVAGALDDAFGAGGITALEPVAGGVSGALTYRATTTSGDHFVRVEVLRGALRNPHQYECLRIAAEAGIAPPVRHLDEEAGVLVLPFLAVRPLAEYPGGPAALAAAVGELARRLQETPRFPSDGDQVDNVRRLLAFLPEAGRVAPGLLDAHAAAFERLAEAMPRHPASFVSAHNDPNPSNLLFDGQQLWLVDWETAGTNDPTLDVALLLQHVAPDPVLADVLVRAWHGADPDDELRARLRLSTHLTQINAGALMLLVIPDPRGPATDLAAPTIDVFQAMVASGELVPGDPVTTLTYARIVLHQFLVGLDSVETQQAFSTLGA